MNSSTIEKNAGDIADIKKAMLKHNKDDEKSFGAINQKLDAEKKGRDTEHREVMDAIERLSVKVEPVVRWFDNITFGKRAIMWVLSLVGGVVAIAIGLKALLK